MDQLKRFLSLFAIFIFVVTLLSPLTVFAGGGGGEQTVKEEVPEDEETEVLANYGKLPLSFIQNQGQLSDDFSFSANLTGSEKLFFAQDKVVMDLDNYVLFLNFIDSNSEVLIVGEDEQDNKTSYFAGDEENWKTNISNYGKVVYQNLYNGIDLVYEGTNNTLKSTYLVTPNANPNQIQLNYEGADRLSINREGALVIHYNSTTLVEKPPYVYQDISGKRVVIASSYKLLDGNTYTFELGDYNANYPLVVDPSLVYSTYLGGTVVDKSEWSNAIARDSSGNIYIVGQTGNSGFPTTVGAYDRSYAGGSYYTDVFVSKFSSDLSSLLASTFISGNYWNNDSAKGVDIDSSGNVYVVGSGDKYFPTTAGAYDTSFNGGSSGAYVAKLNSDLSSLLASTFIGSSSSHSIDDVVVSDDGNSVYIVGYFGGALIGPSFSGYDTSHNGSNDAVVGRFNSSLSSLSNFTYLGGSGYDYGNDIELDSSGNVYVCGRSSGSDYPTTGGVYQGSVSGGYDVVVSKLNSTLTTLSASTYLGGGLEDLCAGLGLNASGDLYLTGKTKSSDFPTTGGVYQTSSAGGDEAFISKLNSTLTSLSASTYLGGSGYDSPAELKVDSNGGVVVAGYTNSADFPLTANAFDNIYDGSTESFVTKINSTFIGPLDHSTYIGGANNESITDFVLDSSDDIYFTGNASSDYPVIAGGYDVAYNGSNDVFISKYTFSTPDTTDPTIPGALTLSATVDSAVVLKYDLDNLSTDDNFSEYKVYYTVGESGVTTDHTEISSIDEAELGNQALQGVKGFKISGLSFNTTYVAAIYAFDDAGNSAKSAEMTFTMGLPLPYQKTVVYDFDADTIMTKTPSALGLVDGYGASISSSKRFHVKLVTQFVDENTSINLGADTYLSAVDSEDTEAFADFSALEFTTTGISTGDFPKTLMCTPIRFGLSTNDLTLLNGDTATVGMDCGVEDAGKTMDICSRGVDGAWDCSENISCVVNGSGICSYSTTHFSDQGGGQEGGGASVPEYSMYVYVLTLMAAGWFMFRSHQGNKRGVVV